MGVCVRTVCACVCKCAAPPASLSLMSRRIAGEAGFSPSGGRKHVTSYVTCSRMPRHLVGKGESMQCVNVWSHTYKKGGM